MIEGADLLGGRYQLRGVVGRGGMADVHDGWDTRLDRAVAIKLMHPGLLTRPTMRRRFEDEARAAASLSHPSIVTVFDTGTHLGTPYIVMERLPGTTLADEIACGLLPQARVESMLDQVLGAVATAHSAGILHRDIKPGNILITASGGALKVTDFGIAKTAGVEYTRTGEVLGTMAYLSPQRIAGAPASVVDDLYAVGVVGYEALAGHPPFLRDNVGALARAIMDESPPPIAALRSDIRPELAAVIDRAMARDPGARFFSAQEMVAVLHGGTPPARIDPTQRLPKVRPATKVFEVPITQQPMSVAYIPSPRGRLGRKAKILLGAGAALAALAMTIAFAALDSPSQPSAPTPVGTSTAVSTPPPVSTSPPPVTEQPPAQRNPGNGHGNGKKGRKGD